MAEVPAGSMPDEPTDPGFANATTQSRTTGPTTGSSKAVRRKFRPTYSCLSCHKRKVKCDRVKPCSACCLRGTPSECEYGTSKQDRHFIHQSTLIENLLHSCQNLKQQLDEARRLANLPPIKDNIVPSPLNLVGAADTSSSPESNPVDANSPTATVDGTEARRPADTASQRPKSQGSSPETDVVALVRTTRTDHDRSIRGFAFATPQSQATFMQQVPGSGTPFFELWIGRLLDAFSPTDHTSGGSLVGLREAADMRPMSPVLARAFEAASLTFVGRQDRKLDMEQEGHVRYTKVLSQLQRALHDPTQSKKTDTLVVVLLFMIIEAFKQSSAKSIYRHQLGGLELLRSRTPYRHRYGIERSMFVDLRSYWVSVAIVHRVPSFLASKEWTTVPWSGDGPDKDMFHHLLDIGIEVPAYLAQLDQFTAALQDPNTLPSDLVTLQSTLWQTATELDRRLQTWKTMSADTYAAGPPLERPQVRPTAHGQQDADTDDEFPVFQCHNISTMEVITPTILVYPDLLLAQSMCYYWALRLIISATESGLVDIISPQERYQAACDICRSMSYYIQTVPGCLATRMMFVLRVAFDAFPDDSIEKRFLETVFSYIGSRLRLTTFINRCVDASLKIESAD